MKKNKLFVQWNAQGQPTCLADPSDPYQMNWLSSHYITGEVRGFSVEKSKITSMGVQVQAKSAEKVQLTIIRKLLTKKYIETYTFFNSGIKSVRLDKDFGAVSYAGNSFFDKQPNMLFTRCNTHVFTGNDITYLYSIHATMTVLQSTPHKVPNSSRKGFIMISIKFPVHTAMVMPNHPDTQV